MHPSKPNLFKYQGRDDDIIVLSNGEKINPLTMESIIEHSQIVRKALVIGQAWFQAGALIELDQAAPTSESAKQAIIDAIWPSIEDANRVSPAHAQLDKEHVLIIDIPFPRTGKGTVPRRRATTLLAHEIDELYAKADEIIFSQVQRYNTSTETALHENVRATVKGIAALDDLSDEDDFFAAGVDWLQVLNLQKLLQAGIFRREDIDSRFIYSHPSINSLAQGLWTLLHPTTSYTAQSPVDAMKSMFEKYATNLPVIWTKSTPSGDALRVILTGSTGSLGSYLLDSLMDDEKVKEIWCLNRSLDGQANQAQVNRERGIRTDWATKNVHFLKTNLSKSLFGLEKDQYENILRKATHIIRKYISAWFC
jgi:hypothetical protein